ncbi:MAG TPA: polyprenyl synthetase family protein [Anaerolineaceae bacterium]|nr:polyprenyl synthetase family protein [Anaerolineaceae bacterium]
MEYDRLTPNITFLNLVHDELLEVETLIRAQAEGYHQDLQAALNHLLGSGGKRVRPAITLLISRILHAPHEKMINLAGSIELLHTATLVHDDLIDGSLLRRGIPTLNARWSPGATVLTGDFLFSAAAKLAADTDSIAVMKSFARTLSTIVNGEITQLFRSPCQLNREQYERQIYAKTGSLFELSSESAALISDTNCDVINAMRKYGYFIGIGFQIIDDILDFTGAQATLGKPVGNDLRQGIITLPAIIHLQDFAETPLVQEFVDRTCTPDDEQIALLVDQIRTSDSIHKAYLEAETYVKKGMEKLDLLPDCPERDALEELAQFIVRRDL